MGFSLKIETIKMQKLQANDGMILTNGESFSSVGGLVYLPENADATKWYEITEGAYKDILSAQTKGE